MCRWVCFLLLLFIPSTTVCVRTHDGGTRDLLLPAPSDATTIGSADQKEKNHARTPTHATRTRSPNRLIQTSIHASHRLRLRLRLLLDLALAPAVHCLPEEMWTPRAANVAAIAERLAAEKQFADPFELEPFYLRKSSAEEKREAKLAAEAENA